MCHEWGGLVKNSLLLSLHFDFYVLIKQRKCLFDNAFCCFKTFFTYPLLFYLFKVCYTVGKLGLLAIHDGRWDGLICVAYLGKFHIPAKKKIPPKKLSRSRQFLPAVFSRQLFPAIFSRLLILFPPFYQRQGNAHGASSLQYN